MSGLATRNKHCSGSLGLAAPQGSLGNPLHPSCLNVLKDPELPLQATNDQAQRHDQAECSAEKTENDPSKYFHGSSFLSYVQAFCSLHIIQFSFVVFKSVKSKLPAISGEQPLKQEMAGVQPWRLAHSLDSFHSRKDPA